MVKHHVSILPTFYEQLNHTKMFFIAFSLISFVILWRNNIGSKAAHKVLVKSIPGRIIIFILRNTYNLKINMLIIVNILKIIKRCSN